MTKHFITKWARVNKFIAALSLAFAFSVFCVMPVKAATPITIIYNGDTDTFVVTPNTDDLFAEFKDLLPGSTTTQDLVVVNQTTTHDLVQIYLEPVSINQTDDKLLSLLTLTISQGDTELFSGTLAESASQTSWYLGEFAPNQTTTLTLTLLVSPELDNSSMYDVGTINWRFSCVKAITDSETPDNPSSTSPTSQPSSSSNTNNSNGSNNPTSNNQTTATSNAASSNDSSEKKPNNTNTVHTPQTGDNNTIILYSILAAVCFVLLIFTFFIAGKKKKKKDDKNEYCIMEDEPHDETT